MNKKLIKTIASITCGLGIVATIPTIASSCCDNENEWPINAIPKDLYDIDENGALIGLKRIISLDEWYSYNTMLIPKNVTQITRNIFTEDAFQFFPNTLTQLRFEEGSKCKIINCDFADGYSFWEYMEFPEGMETIEGGAFCAYGDNINNTKISLPSTIKLIDGAFGTDNIEIHNIRFIEWNGLGTDPETLLVDYPFGYNNNFQNLCSTGTIKVKNPKNGYTSEKLLAWFKTLPGFPQTGWTAE